MKALKHSPSFFLVATLFALFFASTPQTEAALSNTLTWTGTTNTNVTASTNWSASPPYGGANVFNLNNSIYQYVYTNDYNAVGQQTFSYMGSNAGMYGVTFVGYSNVLVTNVGTFRLDAGGINATNAGGGRVSIWNTNTSVLNPSTILKGNMSVYLNNLYNHASTTRTVTNNLNDLAINNLGVNSASQTTIGGANGVNFTWVGTGTTTILGTIMVVAQTNTTGTVANNGALIVSSGTINIVTTNGANASSTATNVDNSNVYGWNSGLVITNSGSVYVSGQNSLGRQAFNIKMGTANGSTTTFGLFDSNNWATNLTSGATLTNNFSILNSGTTATNIFKSVTGKTLTLSGVISSTNTNGILVFLDGTNVLAGANTFSNAVVVSNTTLMLSNASALGATNAGTTVAGTSGRLDLNGQTISGEALTLSNSSAPSLLNSSATAASWSGGVTLAAATTISNTGDITLSGSISGSSSLTKLGAATLILSGSNSYTGGTTISDGALVLSNTNALSGSTLCYSNAGTVSFGSLTGANFGGLLGSNNLALTNASGTALALSVGGNNINTTYSGILSGAGSLTKAGTRTLTLGAANTYEGGTTINAGAINISNGSSFGSGTVTFASNSTTVAALASMKVTNNYVLTGNGTMDVGANIMTNSGVISGAGSLTKAGTGTLLLSSSSNSYGGVTTISGGALQVTDLTDAGIVSPIGTNGTITLTNGGNFDYVGTNSGASMNRALNLAGGNGGIGVSNSSVAVTLSGVISDAGNLVKRGAGTLILSASNSYTGATTVSAGTLALASLTGSAAGSASSVTVTNGATLLLSQSDQVNNSATVTLSGGTIAHGSGVSEVFGNLNLTAASFLDFGTGTAGNLTFGIYAPGSLLTINNFTQGNTLVFGSDLTSTITNSSLFTFTNGAIGSSSWNGGTFTITAIPETSTYVAALGLLALCASPLLRRKRARVS